MSEWTKLKVVDLKAELKRRGLPQGGLKAELVARLEQEDREREGAKDDAPAEGEDDVLPDAVDDGANGVDKTPSLAQDNEALSDAPPQPGPASEMETELEKPNEAAPRADDEAPDAKTSANADTPPDASTEEAPPPPAETLADAPPETAPAQEEISRKRTTSAEAPESQDQTVPSAETGPSDQALESAPDQTATSAGAYQQEQQQQQQPQSPPDARGSSVPKQAPEQPVEPLVEAQKRKRRSTSPVLQEEDVARKRARAHEDLFRKPSQHDTMARPPTTADIDHDRHVEPSIHPATSALCINNLMRPLRPADLRAHIVSLAAGPDSSAASDDLVTKFHLDFIRTHAFIGFDSVSSASRVRQLLHGRVWPNESNRKALSIDFIPPEKIDSWIDIEEEDGAGRRPGNRWEVAYTSSPDGSTVEANLVSTSLSASSTRPSAAPPPSQTSHNNRPRSFDAVNSAPLGPRGHMSDFPPPPTGPRDPRGPRSRPPPPAAPLPPSPTFANTPPGSEQYTRARPSIAYALVPETLARRRIDNMQSFYTRDVGRDVGREINRYSFEDGDSFVDRGKEIFEGIRPPHRERGGRGGGDWGRGGGAGGRRRGPGGGFRPRSDRYFPGEGRDDDYRRRY